MEEEIIDETIQSFQHDFQVEEDSLQQHSSNKNNQAEPGMTDFDENNFLFIDGIVSDDLVQVGPIINYYAHVHGMISEENSNFFQGEYNNANLLLDASQHINTSDEGNQSGQWSSSCSSGLLCHSTSQTGLIQKQKILNKDKLQRKKLPQVEKESKHREKQLVIVGVKKRRSDFSFRMCNQRPLMVMNPLFGFHFISGDVCVINLMMPKVESEGLRYSGLNSFKSATRTITNKAIGTFEIDVSNKRSGLKDFTFLIDKLTSLSDIRFVQFGQRLAEYQVMINSLMEKRSLLTDEPSMNKYTLLLEESYEKFEIIANEKLVDLSKTSTFYMYTVYRLNLLNFEMEMRKFGYSQALLALLGLDFEATSSFIWRRGLFDFIDKQGLDTMLQQLISHKLGYPASPQFDTKLLTFDGMDVYAKGSTSVVMSKDPNNPFLPYNEILMTTEFEVSHTMIAQVIDVRQNASKQSLRFLRDVQDDLQYSMEATVFLEKYYKSKVEAFLPSHNRAGFKVIQNESRRNGMSNVYSTFEYQ